MKLKSETEIREQCRLLHVAAADEWMRRGYVTAEAYLDVCPELHWWVVDLWFWEFQVRWYHLVGIDKKQKEKNEH